MNSATAMMPESQAEPTMLLKRIGSTVYTVAVHFSQAEKETMEDKILRLIESDPLARFVPTTRSGGSGVSINA